MVVPNSLGRLQEAGQYPRPGEHAGWLGKRYNPLTTQIDKKSLTDNPYWRDCTDEELTFQIAGMTTNNSITLNQWQNRRSLMEQFDEERRRSEGIGNPSTFDAFRQRAFALVTSEKTRDALNIRSGVCRSHSRLGRTRTFSGDVGRCHR